MKKYSSKQLEAIKTNSKHLAVIAGAGTGKTTVLIARINYLINNSIDAKDILAITFTKKAANEMKERLKNDLVDVLTFDAFCYNLVKNDIKEYTIFDNQNIISNKELLDINLYDANLRLKEVPVKYNVFKEYKESERIVDFNDIEYLALEYIKKHSIKYKYILIDEFQDTNNLQFEIFKNLVNKYTTTFIVGDPDQSIYKFRGANIKIINDYINLYNANLLILDENYRSNNLIIQVANNLISNNTNRFKKELISIKKNCGIAKVLFFYNAIIEYNYIINFIEVNYNNKYSYAILFRNHEQGFIYKKYYYNSLKHISIISIHESKGLEFDIVFIIGLNKSIIPSIRDLNNSNIEEERRLLFVAITRAKQELYLCVSNNQSRFIKELKLNGKKVFHEIT